MIFIFDGVTLQTSLLNHVGSSSLKDWALSIQPKILEVFETGTIGTEISRERFQKVRKLLNFRQKESLNQNFRKLRDENQMERMERKFLGKKNRELVYTSGGCPLFW